MSPIDYRECKFEEAMENYLINHGGYVKGSDQTLDKESMLDVEILLKFIKTTQPKEWEKYQRIYASESENKIIERIKSTIKKNGLIKTLRTGIKDRGTRIQIAFFKPETHINKESIDRYDGNILTCVRQFHYSRSNRNSIDTALLLNGIPIVAIEFKNQLTGQNVQNAIDQFKHDRSPNEPIFQLNERFLVYFAVDTTNVYMTTHLKGDKTRFLPFNQGSNGPGNVGGKGNPDNPNGFDTSYLWENVLYKDSLMEILHKFIHEEDDRLKTIIFPRYHQLDCVRKLLESSRRDGPGKDYLIQHSAGSGKSNSIAWLAHRLAGMHDEKDEKVFHSVIVVTDRRVLDNQLQNTIYQFDHIPGVVMKVDKHSSQLLEAINEGKPIIITTLQKFPVIYKEVSAQNRRFAIIADEAHSSQSGISSQKLKEALGDREHTLEEYAEIEGDLEDMGFEDDPLTRELGAQGKHDNLSFFAFTATPKAKTLQMFGERQEDGSYCPFHTYSMRQAIEEEFIIDVLRNYTTYKIYYKILKKAVDDPKLKRSEAIKKITRFESLHPYSIMQKTEIIIEHFRSVTRNKINGKAKAMVVTSSRLHAVRYYDAFKEYISRQGYDDLDVLVAFSGSLIDNGVEYIEQEMNWTRDGLKIKEDQLPKYFREDFDMLIVADKYQTGFDEPLLHTMFVDKKLSGVKAVQTLSRLNRIMPGKTDTFVLDFQNSMDDIGEAFQPYYEATTLETGIEPNIIYDIKDSLDEYRIWSESEITSLGETYYGLGEMFYGRDKDQAIGVITSYLSPALKLYKELEKDKQDNIRSEISRFIRLYSFITQIHRMFDKDMQHFHIYLKFLYKFLPRDKEDPIRLDDKVALDYFKIVKDEEGSIELGSEADALMPPVGGTRSKNEEECSLSEAVEKINERFGTEFTEMDKVLQQIVNDMGSDPMLVAFAKENNIDTFATIFKERFENAASSRYVQNEEFFVRLFQDREFMETVISQFMPIVHSRLQEIDG